MRQISVQELARLLADRQSPRRFVVAIAGPPGAGKSTLAEDLTARLNAFAPGRAAILSMDGFHFDDMVLVPRGLRSRKGAPETFDVAGFIHMLERLRRNQEPEIAVPVFDRTLEIARAGARLIPKSVDTLIVEGNYLLLDRTPWNALSFDMSVLLKIEKSTLRNRLLKRWTEMGFLEEDARKKVDENDMVNAELVLNSRTPCDFIISEANAV